MTPRRRACVSSLASLLACNGGGAGDGTSADASTGTAGGSSTVAGTADASSTATTVGSTVGDGSSGDDGSSDGGTTGDDGGAPVTESPWGIASSHSSSQGLDAWASVIAETGLDWLRGFDTANAQARLDTAEANGLSVSGILFYSAQEPASFPVDDLPGWQAHITALLGETSDRVHHWEVWNEPPNFSANKSPQDYATIVASAYEAAKAVDPTVEIGLAAQSNNVNFLDQALLAGAAGSFDYVTVHPYEILDLVDAGWEAEYMAVVPTLRKMLAARDPAHTDVPVWFTEIGEPVDGNHTPEHQAGMVVKAYTLAIAQGATRVHWFEGRDGDSGPFGLIDGTGALRPSYTAMTTLRAQLGPLPFYRGWVLLGDAHYGFVFTRDDVDLLVAWAQPGTTYAVEFDDTVTRIDPQTGDAASAAGFVLDPQPSIFTDIPASMLEAAKANRDRRLWWGGDFADASEVEYTAAGGAAGLHPIGTPVLVDVDGEPARDVGGGPGLAFTVDPAFLSYDTVEIEIEAVLRRNGAQPAGFNLKYEGVGGNASVGQWYDVPADDAWTVKSWTITDDQFVGKWGYNFSFDSDSTTYSQYSLQRVTVRKL